MARLCPLCSLLMCLRIVPPLRDTPPIHSAARGLENEEHLNLCSPLSLQKTCAAATLRPIAHKTNQFKPIFNQYYL